MKRLFLQMILPFLALSASAQVMSLKDCLDGGLENNYQIRIARTDEQVSANNDSWGVAGAVPSLDLSARYNGSVTSRNTNYRETSETDRTRDVLDQTLSASLGVSWTVFNGFKVQATRERLRELHAQGELRTRIAIEDFVAQMASEYYNYLRQSIRLDNLNYSVALSRERVRIVQERYNIGNNSRLDLKQAQVYFNADSAASLKQNEALATARIRINKLMAESNLDRYFVVADTAISLLPELDFMSLERDMLESNLSLVRAESDNRIAQDELRSVNSRNYPYLRLNADYGYSRNIYSSGASSSRDNWGPGFGATVGLNILDGKHRTDRLNAKLNVENAELNRQDVEQSLRANLADLWQAYQNNLRLLALERQNLLTAQESHDIACERYLIGDLSGLEMREAQKSLLSAEESLLQVEYDTKICEISLMQISGHVLEYMNYE